MEFIRVFVNPRRSMQRVGFLKHLLWRASKFETNNISNLGKGLVTAVSQKVSLAPTPNIREYITKCLTGSLHRNLQMAAVRDTKVEVEIQDAYLADPNIPSHRGRLHSDAWNRYIYLALGLGLIHKGNYSLLTRGKILLSFLTEIEKTAFNTSSIICYKENVNPFTLSVQQKVLLLFSFIERDGDVLKKLYPKILAISKQFSGKEIGNYLPEIYRTISKEYKPKARSGDDLQRMQKIIDTAAKIEAVQQNPSPGGKNAREHATDIRLEPFVDFGLLIKPDPFTYQYQTTNATKIFFQPLIKAESINCFLEQSFFEASNKALALNGEHQTSKDVVLPAIQKAYGVLKNPLGYASILEMCLLAGIYSITERRIYFELSESLDILKSFQKERPKLVRFNVDRWGKLSFVKFDSDITK